MKLPRRYFLQLAMGAAALSATSRNVLAAEHPAPPVRILVTQGTSLSEEANSGRRDFSIRSIAQLGQAQEKPAAADRGQDAAEARWLAIKNSKAPDLFEGFFENFPDSPHRREARDRLEELKPATAIDEMTWRNLLSGEGHLTDPAMAFLYEVFVEKFPRSPRVSKTRERLAALKRKGVGPLPLEAKGSAAKIWLLSSQGSRGDWD